MRTPTHTARNESAIPIEPITRAQLPAWLAAHPDSRDWISTLGFKAEPGSHAFLPDRKPSRARVLAAPTEGESVWAFAGLPMALPEGTYRLETKGDAQAQTDIALGWALGSYEFSRYRKPRRAPAKLAWPAKADRAEVERVVSSVGLARDLINTPCEDMGPEHLADAATTLANEFGAGGKPDAPRVTLVGKGVCFDTGGLDLKPREGMLDMKKDMGGAAVMLGLARALMSANVPIRLRVLIPAVENSVSANAYRQVQALFCDDDEVARGLIDAGAAVGDPLWRLPIWRPYRKLIDGKCADLNNVAPNGFAGSIIGALYLAEFVSKAKAWVHLDIMASNTSTRPGRPEGGEATGMRALYAYIRERYAR